MPDKSKKKFSWKEHLNPNNEEFYKEGNHRPPAPFVEVAKNPTDKNISMWLKYLEMKNKLASRLQNRISEYVQKNNKVPIEVNLKEVKKVNIKNAGRFKIRMYFESTCPHCKRMMATLNQLQNEGYYVEALQLNKGPLLRASYPLRLSSAKAGDATKHKITSVPFTLIADLKNKVISKPITGFQSPEQIKNILLLMEKKN